MSEYSHKCTIYHVYTLYDLVCGPAQGCYRPDYDLIL
jgi:hypothetical protein